MKRQPRIPLLVLALALLVLVGVLSFRALFPKRSAAPVTSSPAAAATSAPRQTPPRPSAGDKNQSPRSPLRLASGTAETDAALANGAFEGRVVSWSTGRGVAGATVTFVHAGVTSSVTAGEGGNFKFIPSEAGIYSIAIVAAEGYLPFAPAIDQSPLTLAARPGERIRDILLYLTPAVQYLGVVQNPLREPVAGAEVRLFDEDGGDLKIASLPDRFKADAKGEFRFSAPDYALLEATHPDFSPGRARVDFAVQTSRRAVLRLKPKTESPARAAIAGRVVDSKGAPVEGAQVVAQSTKALPPAFENAVRTSISATSDEEGKFEIETIAGERYNVTASRPELAPGEALDVASDTRDLTLTLTRGASLRGVVRDRATGAPVVAFTVNVLRSLGPLERQEYQVMTFFDAQGRYEITGLGPGSFIVLGAAHGYAASNEIPFTISDPPADPPPVDIALSRGGRLSGSVLEEGTKKPIERARVSLEGRSNQSSGSAPLLVSTTTGSDGRFELSGLSAGLRSITVVAEGHHGRIVSGLAVAEGGDLGPITVELAKTEEGEEPRLELTGIGAVLSAKDDGLIIGQVLPGGGAAEAGLQPGDVIVGIDGFVVAEIGFEQAVQRIRGPEGSSVALVVRRAAGGEPVEILVTRRRIRPQ
jgi:hypothetical protein